MFLIFLYFSLSSMGSSCSQCATDVLNPETREILLLAGLCFEPEVRLDDFLRSVTAQITPSSYHSY